MLPDEIDQMKLFQLIQIIPTPTRAALASGNFAAYRISDPRIMGYLRNNSMFTFGKADRARTSATFREILDAMWLFTDKFERARAKFAEIKAQEAGAIAITAALTCSFLLGGVMSKTASAWRGAGRALPRLPMPSPTRAGGAVTSSTAALLVVTPHPRLLPARGRESRLTSLLGLSAGGGISPPATSTGTCGGRSGW